MYYSIARSGVAPTRVPKMPISQGCHPRRFFYFIFIMLDVIGTCMQNFNKIYRKKKLKIFHLKICCILFRSHCTFTDECVRVPTSIFHLIERERECNNTASHQSKKKSTLHYTPFSLTNPFCFDKEVKPLNTLDIPARR